MARLVDRKTGKTLGMMLKKRTTIGRFHENHVVLHDPMVSREHAVVIKGWFRFYIEDLKSKFGIFVNGKRIRKRTRLHDGDRILIAVPRCEEAEVMKPKEGKKETASTLTFRHDQIESIENMSVDQLMIGADMRFVVR